jgi:hypothetical protein
MSMAAGRTRHMYLSTCLFHIARRPAIPSNKRPMAGLARYERSNFVVLEVRWLKRDQLTRKRFLMSHWTF